MKFKIHLTASAAGDIQYFSAYEQRIITQAIREHLREDANLPSNKRKVLRPNELAPWELKFGKYRVFYDFEGKDSVKIIAVGYKEHNDVYIHGKKVEL